MSGEGSAPPPPPAAGRDARNRAFRARALGGAQLFGTFLQMGSPVSADVCAGAGFDWCLVDLEHGLGAEAALLAELLALEVGGAAAIVRVETGAPLRIGRALDLGAAGLMVPRVRSAAEAAAAVAGLRYPPQGVRGVALSARSAGYGLTPHDGLPAVNAGITTMIQIENEPALADAVAIASVDGVDVLFVGPNDLTHSLGIPGRFDEPVYHEAIAHIGRACAATGKAAGILLRSPEDLDEHLALGYSVFALLSDSGLLARAARAALAELRGPRG